jgi:VWFA-related protein
VKALVVFCALSASQAAQVPDSGPTIHAETRVVQIDVVVTDSHHKPIADLQKQDFTLTDNGKLRTIDIFSLNGGETVRDASTSPTAPATAKPPSAALPANTFSNRNAGPPNVPAHSTVIVLDQVNAFFEDAGYARQQVMDLMGKLKPDERIALYVIIRRRGLAIIQDYTTDHKLLLKNLSRYKPQGLAPRPGFPEPWPIGVQDLPLAAKPPSDHNPAKQTLEEKEYTWHENSEQARHSLQALAEQLALVPGRKSVYWVTQAFPARLMQGMGQPAWDKTLTALNEANVAVNTVDSRGLFGGGRPARGTIAAMQQIAETTGGNAYFGRNDLDAAMAEGIAASRVSYTLAFYLAENERDNKFHALHVKANRPDLKSGLELFYRQGYYAGNADLPDSSRDKGDIESSLLNQVNSAAVGITARVTQVQGTPQGTLNMVLNLDPATLSLKPQAAGWNGKVEETFVELDESGNTLAKLSDIKVFEVSTTGRAHYDSHGVTWPFSMPLMPAAQKLSIIIRDSASGHVGSLTVPLHDETRLDPRR